MDNKTKLMLKGIRHIALDMDGTIYLGSTLFPYTLPFLEKLGRLGISYSFLTNNPTKSIEDYVGKLHKLGVPCTNDQMYSTATASIDYIKKHYPGAKRLFIMGTPSMISQFTAAGFEVCADSAQDRPDVLLVAFDMTLTYDKLCRAAYWAAHKGIPYIATNPDWVCPTDQPTVLVDCGSMCECIYAATSRRPDIVIGKPNPDILLGVLDQKYVKPSEAMMVGDRLYTDVKTALNAGACGVLVLSGETTIETALNASENEKPTIICKDIEELGNLLEEARLC